MEISGRTDEKLNQNGQNLVRILISSYFIAVALGLIEGTDGSVLMALFLPPDLAGFAGSALVFALAYLVLMGVWMRPAALLLGMVLFWSSYIINFGPQGPLEVGDFWRDLALIGALMMTYNASPRARRRSAILRRTPRVRKIKPGDPVLPRRISPTRPEAVARGRLPSLRPTSFVEGNSDNIFREEDQPAPAG
jgi:uncharacterized membrane protein YphA (DoxX/SURF4 family)